jgi:hypothetical protein
MTGRSSEPGVRPLDGKIEIQPFLFAGVVVEPQAAPRGVGHVGQDVVVRDGDLADLDVLGMHECPVVHDRRFPKQHGAISVRRNRIGSKGAWFFPSDMRA